MIKLFHGKDSFLSLKNAKQEISRLKKELGIENSVSIDAQSSHPEYIINLFLTNDMFSDSKIVLLKRLTLNKEKEKIIEFIIKSKDSISKSNHYIFWEDGKISSITKYFKFFGKDIVESNKMNKPSFVKWAGEQIKNEEINLDRNTLITLCESVNYESERLINEINKYSLLGIKVLKIEDIIENTTNTLEHDIWKLISLINQGNSGKSIEIFNNLIQSQQDPNYILAMLIRNLRLITEVKYLSDKNTQSKEICSTLRIAPFALPELSRASKSIDWKKIKFLYEKFSSLDCEIKRGNIDAQLGITLLISRIN